MRFKVTMKDPDTLHDAIDDAIDADLDTGDMDRDELEAVQEIRKKKLLDLCSTWFKYSEYLTVEIDTATKTIRVLEAK